MNHRSSKAFRASFFPSPLPPAGRIALCLLLPFLLSSCTAARLTAPPLLPASFSASGEAGLQARWWQAFNDPILDRLIDRALAGNFTLRGAWARLDQAGALARKAGAGLTPSLNGEVEAEAGQRRREEGSGADSGSDSLSLGLAASYEVDLWGRVRSARDAADLDLRASREDLETAAQTLAAGVAAAWYELVEQRGQLEILERQFAALKQSHDLLSLRFRNGQTGLAELLRQQQALEQNRGEKAQGEARERLLSHRLAILLGLPPTETVAERVIVLAGLPPLPATGVPADLLQRRPDLKSAWLKVQAADARTAAALADRFPRLGLSARLDTENGSGMRLFDNWFTGLAASLTAPLLDGGLRQAEVQRTGAAAEEALASYRQAALTALGEVEDALAREERQEVFLRHLLRQQQAADLLAERLRDRYLLGGLDYLQALDARLSSQALERSRLAARHQLLANRIDLHRALAGGFAPPAPAPDKAAATPPGPAPTRNHDSQTTQEGPAP